MNRPNSRSRTSIEKDQIERALGYPFALSAGSYVICGGKTFPIVHFDAIDPRSSVIGSLGAIRTLADAYRAASGAILAEPDLVPILASGSNASPDRLTEKFADIPGAFVCVLKGFVTGICPVYSAHITRYGSISATLHRVSDARAEVFCVLLPRDLLSTMHKSEAIGVNYGFYQLPGIQFEADGGVFLSGLHTYLSLWGALLVEGQPISVSAFKVIHKSLVKMDQADIMSQVHRLVGGGVELEEFILGNIQDTDLRRDRIERLSSQHSVPVNLGFAQRLV